MISTVTQLNISETNNSVDGTDGNWSIVSAKDELYVVNNTYDITTYVSDVIFVYAP